MRQNIKFWQQNWPVRPGGSIVTIIPVPQEMDPQVEVCVQALSKTLADTDSSQ